MASYRIERKGYVFHFDGVDTTPVQKKFAELTQTPGSDFTWHDAAIVSSKMREIQHLIEGKQQIAFRVIYYREFPVREKMTFVEYHLTANKYLTFNEVIDKHKQQLQAGWYVDVSVVNESTALAIEVEETQFYEVVSKTGVSVYGGR